MVHLFLCAPLPDCQASEAPSVGYEFTGLNGGSWSNGNPQTATESQTFFAKLLYPLEITPLRGYLVPEFDAMFQMNEDSVSQSSTPLSTAVTGLTFYSPAREGTPEWYLIANRYSDFSFGGVSGAMWEFMVGLTLTDLPPLIDSHWKNRNLIAFRVRRFPATTVLLPIVGRTFLFPGGFSFNLEIPVEAVVEWVNANQSWILSGGGRFRDYQYPLSSNGPAGWLQGYTTELFVGAAYRLFRTEYLALETGMQSQSLERLDGATGLSQSFTGNFSPWVRVAFGTRFPKGAE